MVFISFIVLVVAVLYVSVKLIYYMFFGPLELHPLYCTYNLIYWSIGSIITGFGYGMCIDLFYLMRSN